MTNSNQPASLPIFFLTEMWERYGFYVVQSLLALYLAFRYHWHDDNIYALVGSFTALTYLSPVVGGYIADNLLGQKNAVLAGAVVLFLSYVALALLHGKLFLIMALAGVSVGTGLLKPNISSLLGNQYPSESHKREAGFTIFYMGITTGIILGTTLPSILNNQFGWSFSYLSAAGGMIIAFCIFSYGIHRYKITDYHPVNLKLFDLLQALGIMIGLWLIALGILKFPTLANMAFLGVVLFSLFYLLMTLRKESAKQARQTAVIGLLCLISIMFWAFYFQMFMSLTLFLARVAEPTFLGIAFPPPYYVGVQSIGMLIFGYFLAKSKIQLDSAQCGMRTGNKFLLAMIVMSLAYGLIVLVCKTTENNALLSPLFFIPAYLLISIAELLLSPVGLAAITVLASSKRVSTMMGIFFVSLGIGGFLSGKLASLTAVNAKGLSILELKSHYAATFSDMFIILIIATLICGLLNVTIRRLLSKCLR